MMDFFFFVKTFILTVAVVLVLQIPVGEQSLETHAMGFVQNSALIVPLQTVARGATKMVHDLSHQISNAIHNNYAKTKKEEPSKKGTSFRWTHSLKPASTDTDGD